jgi:aflatoxin B1 aldehyde reductase
MLENNPPRAPVFCHLLEDLPSMPSASAIDNFLGDLSLTWIFSRPRSGKAMDAAYLANEFKKFGISNYTAGEVEEIVAVCERNRWVKPSVYQGQHNAITRRHKDEMLPILRNHGISFYAYR